MQPTCSAVSTALRRAGPAHVRAQWSVSPDKIVQKAGEIRNVMMRDGDAGNDMATTAVGLSFPVATQGLHFIK